MKEYETPAQERFSSLFQSGIESGLVSIHFSRYSCYVTIQIDLATLRPLPFQRKVFLWQSVFLQEDQSLWLSYAESGDLS